MNKQEFLAKLRKGLSALPQDDIEERLLFYSEMIDDYVEEGLSEEKAVLAVGSADEIVKQTVADTPIAKIVKERNKPQRRMSAGEIVLLILGSPIWLSLGIAAFAVILSLYVSVWSIIISLWSVFVSLVACTVGGIVSGVVLAICTSHFTGIAMLGASLVCAGLSIFMFCGCKALTKGILILTKKTAGWIKNRFSGKEKE